MLESCCGERPETPMTAYVQQVSVWLSRIARSIQKILREYDMG